MPGLVTIFALAHLPAALLFGVAPKAVDLGAAVAADVAIGVAEDELADPDCSFSLLLLASSS